MEIDKSQWGEGPWSNEPDRVEWESNGFPCLIVRNNLGALCGYVAVSPGHPWHGAYESDVEADVHGGLTYSGACAGHICHVAKPGEPDDVWWLGFDCNHVGDLDPVSRMFRKFRSNLFDGGTYRDIAYVTAEVEGLAQQAAQVVKPC